MKELPLPKALTYIEPGPLTLVTTFDGQKPNVMTISWTAAIDFDQHILLTTGPWNHSFETLLKTKECVVCIPGPDMLKTAVKIRIFSRKREYGRKYPARNRAGNGKHDCADKRLFYAASEKSRKAYNERRRKMYENKQRRAYRAHHQRCCRINASDRRGSQRPPY